MSYTFHYYDLVLVVIAGSLLAGVGVGVATAIAITVAVPVFTLVAIGVILHALFVRGPVDDLEDLTEEVEPEEVPGVAVAAQVVD